MALDLLLARHGPHGAIPVKKEEKKCVDREWGKSRIAA